jgi:hypothetical protein
MTVLRIAVITGGTSSECGHTLGADQPKSRIAPALSSSLPVW